MLLHMTQHDDFISVEGEKYYFQKGGGLMFFNVKYRPRKADQVNTPPPSSGEGVNVRQ